MKRLKLLLSIVGFIAVFLLCGTGLRYLLTDDTTSFTRVMMHEFYEESPDIDVLFVGSSHCYRSLDTEIADRIFGKTTFNAGSSAQLLDGSFAMIREAAAHNDLKAVYLELYYAMALSPNVADRTDMTNVYILSDYMRPSVNKLQYLLQASTKQYYSNSFCIARRNWEKLYDWPYITKLLQSKSAPAYRDYAYFTSAGMTYKGKGHVVMQDAFPDGAIYTAHHSMRFHEDAVYDGWQETLLEIVDFCEKRGIELILFSTPVENIVHADTGNYDDYIAFVRNLIRDRNVRYYDFNLCKEAFFPAVERYYHDLTHINEAGAKRFSTVFSEFFAGRIPEEELFYRSFAEKLQSIPPDVFGVLAETDAENACVRVSPITNAALSDITVQVTKHTDGQSAVFEANAVDGALCIPYVENEVCTLEITTHLAGTERTRVTVPYGQ